MRGPKAESDLEVRSPVSMVEPGTPKIRSSDQRPKRGRTISRACSTSASTVIALENAKQIGLKRLCAQADPVHAGRGQDVGLLGVEVPGLASTVHSPPGARINQRLISVVSRASGGASSRVGVPPPTKIVSTSWGSTRAAVDLAFEGGQVAVGQMVDARQRREVAVTAFVGAEWDVHVGRTRPAPAWLGGTLRVTVAIKGPPRGSESPESRP